MIHQKHYKMISPSVKSIFLEGTPQSRVTTSEVPAKTDTVFYIAVRTNFAWTKLTTSLHRSHEHQDSVLLIIAQCSLVKLQTVHESIYNHGAARTYSFLNKICLSNTFWIGDVINRRGLAKLVMARNRPVQNQIFIGRD